MRGLLTFGAFADMFNLLRNAQESFSCFWYLRREPSDAGEWLDIQKASKSLVKRGKEDYAQFLRKVSKKFHRETSQKLNYKDQYSLLSTLGTHTNPHSMSLSLPKEGREMHFGFFSVGDDENLRCCAHDVLQLVMSLLERFTANLGNTFRPALACTRYQGRIDVATISTGTYRLSLHCQVDMSAEEEIQDPQCSFYRQARFLERSIGDTIKELSFTLG